MQNSLVNNGIHKKFTKYWKTIDFVNKILYNYQGNKKEKIRKNG